MASTTEALANVADLRTVEEQRAAIRESYSRMCAFRSGPTSRFSLGGPFSLAPARFNATRGFPVLGLSDEIVAGLSPAASF
ncbi:hypothetical protein MPNT_210047 [Candidatus Methylacidithermus pantelleriae]|uniref:Uncharacterized protein n=1 Tax=Candidatus Methylacidithermus pantelleriae TaxID=2744239 RepID=A0A8J2FS99_9BACT|nr:hypothetical protein MPNT_210047 [Candidatus Methylacidithermus pantelleriae]